jgi:hypothetical protein
MILGYSPTYSTPTSPPSPDVPGTRAHTSSTGDTPLDMTMTRGNRPPPSYSQSVANCRNGPARPSVITCAPPASTSWGDRSSESKGTNKDENGRQGHRRELLSGEFKLWCSMINALSKSECPMLVCFVYCEGDFCPIPKYSVKLTIRRWC